MSEPAVGTQFHIRAARPNVADAFTRALGRRVAVGECVAFRVTGYGGDFVELAARGAGGGDVMLDTTRKAVTEGLRECGAWHPPERCGQANRKG